jgi:hypothetical protein
MTHFTSTAFASSHFSANHWGPEEEAVTGPIPSPTGPDGASYGRGIRRPDFPFEQGEWPEKRYDDEEELIVALCAIFVELMEWPH